MVSSSPICAFSPQAHDRKGIKEVERVIILTSLIVIVLIAAEIVVACVNIVVDLYAGE